MKLSIITICYNDKAGFEKTARSVIAQTYKSLTPSPCISDVSKSPEGEGCPWEWIIVDGASTDGGAELIDDTVNTQPLARPLDALTKPVTQRAP